MEAVLRYLARRREEELAKQRLYRKAHPRTETQKARKTAIKKPLSQEQRARKNAQRRTEAYRVKRRTEAYRASRRTETYRAKNRTEERRAKKQRWYQLRKARVKNAADVNDGST